jgi:ligand-binding SRPBCC domain-containing protein
MPVFTHAFIVRAPLKAVADFHRHTRALRRLTPPPIWVQFHRLDPLGENSISDFTLWFGPFPVRWTAQHSQVDPLHGFTDTQIRGTLQSWVHTHTFEAIDPSTTRIQESITYEYPPGLRGWLACLLYSPLPLRFLFTYRQIITRLSLERKSPP